MNQEPIKYKDVMDLGFKRTNARDSHFMDEYGFDYFIVFKRLTDNIMLDWDINERTVHLIRVDQDENIKKRKPVFNYCELTEIIEFFKDK